MRKNSRLFVLSLMLLPIVLFADIGDPGFEQTAPGELPLWSGAQWTRHSEFKFQADIVSDAARARSGKQFLRVRNTFSHSANILAYPSMKCIPGYGFKVSAWFRGDANVYVGLTPYDAKDKYVPWKSTHGTPLKKLSGEKWELITLKYVPLEGEVSVMFGFNVRSGLAEVDDYSVELYELSPEEVAASQAVQPEKAAPKKAAVVAEKSEDWKPKGNGRSVCTDFEDWKNGLPAGWILEEGDGATVVRRCQNQDSERKRYGGSSMFLNGKVIMEPQLCGLSDRRGRPVMASFFARGENGHIIAKLREGVDGRNVDFLCELVDEDTGAEWKKYAVQLSTHPFAGVDNLALELTGSNVFIDNAMVGTVTGSDGLLKYSIPLVASAPKVDGVIAAGEWDMAMGGSDPFQVAVDAKGQAKPNTPALQRQGDVKFCSDGKRLYFLVTVPNAVNLLADCKGRDEEVYCDDCIELHLNPELGKHSPKYAYQFVFNSNNAVFDQRREGGGLAPEYVKWNAQSLKYVSQVVDEVWIIEGSLELGELGLVVEKPFGMNVCMCRHNPEEDGSLNGASFLDCAAMVEAVVSGMQPCFHWSRNGDWGTMMVTVGNPAQAAGDYELAFNLNAEKTSTEVLEKVHLGAGCLATKFLNVPGGAGTFGSFVMELKTADGKVAARQTMDFNSAIPIRKTAEKRLGFHLLPEQGKYALNVHLDTGKFEDMAKVAVNGISDKEILFDRSDFTKFENTLVLKRDFVPQDGRKYSVNIAALNAEGTVLDAVTSVIIGNSSLIPKANPQDVQGILPPYTPIVVKGDVVQVNLRSYKFGGNALPWDVDAQGRQVLDAPARLTAELEDGSILKGKPGKFQVLKASGEEITFTGETAFPGFTVKLTGRMEYDGTIFYHAVINAEQPSRVKRLSLEVPFRRLDYFHSFMDSQLRLWMCRQPAEGEYRHPSVKVWTPDSILYWHDFRLFNLFFFPAGDGLLWSSRNVVPGVIKNGFLPYMTFGNHQYGMEIFADTDRGWVNGKKSSVNEIWRKDGKELVRVNFVAVPCTLEGNRELDFGLLVTPARRVARDPRYNQMQIIGYSHTGLTDQTLCGLRAKDWKLLAKQHERVKNRKVIPTYLCCKGHFPQTDPVSQYMDSEWRSRPDYEFIECKNWLVTRQFGTDIRNYINPSGCYTPGRLNFYGERFREIISKLPAMGAVYWDENWFKPCNNPNHAECGYLLPDGQLQGRAWWTGLREVDKRVRHIFMEFGRQRPILDGFTGEGIIPHAYSFADFNQFGEHFTYDRDFIDYWTPHFMEIAGGGAWGFGVAFFGMFRDPKYLTHKDLHRAQLALVKLFNANFNWGNFNYEFYKPCRNAEERFGVYEPDVEFAGYFSEEGKCAVPGLPCTVKASMYVRAGKGALIYISNLGEEPFKRSVKLDLSRWNINDYEVFDAEVNKPLDLNEVSIGRHDFHLLEVKVRK